MTAPFTCDILAEKWADEGVATFKHHGKGFLLVQHLNFVVYPISLKHQTSSGPLLCECAGFVEDHSFRESINFDNKENLMGPLNVFVDVFHSQNHFLTLKTYSLLPCHMFFTKTFAPFGSKSEGHGTQSNIQTIKISFNSKAVNDE